MFLVLESYVYHDTQNLNVVFWYHRLPLDSERLIVRFTYLRNKVYDSRLVRFKGRSTSLFLVERLVDDGFNSFPVTLRGRTGHPRGKIIHESDCSFLAVDLSLHEVCVKEKKQNRR
jgi:PII-like signaling protein